MPRRGRKTNKTGRNEEHQYWQFPYSMARSDAFRRLSGPATKVLIELRCRYNGFNNGRITLSYEEAVRFLGLSKSTVKRAYDELREVGFIMLHKQGRWHGRMASEWRLTFVASDGKPETNEWKLWKSTKPLIPTKKTKARYPNGIPPCFDDAA
jgi:hypothetical protein